MIINATTRCDRKHGNGEQRVFLQTADNCLQRWILQDFDVNFQSDGSLTRPAFEMIF